MEFSFIFSLYEGASGSPANEGDCAAYAATIGYPDFPVFADGQYSVTGATPMTNITHPEMCALTPELEIIECYADHGGAEYALDAIRNHAGL